jgi:hypothetical protein
MEHPPRQTGAGLTVVPNLLPAMLLATLVAGCAGEAPDALPGPIEPRLARMEDTGGIVLPDPASGGYCQAAQQILASTDLTGTVTVFTDMTAYRKSKPAANPHRIYQVVTYAGDQPIAVSCKVKTAAHLRAVYGPDAAGTQRNCVDLTGRARDQAAARLEATGRPEAAARVRALVLDDNEPFVTGRAYLEDFRLSYVDETGGVHLSSPGLFQNYDSWITRFLPWKFRGQHYCHSATPDYIEALATGRMEPGTLITTTEDAPVSPPAPAGS